MEKWGREGRRLGKGTYGTVHAIETAFVVKTIYSEDDEFEKDVGREIDALTKLLGKPNIVQLQASFIQGEVARLIFPRYDGDLVDAIVSKRCPPDAFKQIVTGLHHCHENGIIHRDLKPGNILIRGGKELVIADFGLSKMIQPKRDVKRMKEDYASRDLFSLSYRPYELAMSDCAEDVVVTYASDIWSLGCIWLELTTGTRMFSVSNHIELRVAVEVLMALLHQESTIACIKLKYNKRLQELIAMDTAKVQEQQEELKDSIKTLNHMNECKRALDCVDRMVKQVKEETKLLSMAVKKIPEMVSRCKKNIKLMQDGDHFELWRTMMSPRPEKRPQTCDILKAL